MQARLIIILLIFGIAPVILVRALVVSDYESRAVLTHTNSMADRTHEVAIDIGESEFFDNNSDDIIIAEVDQLARFFEGRAFIVDDGHKVIYDTMTETSDATGKEMVSSEYTEALAGRATVVSDLKLRRLTAAYPIKVENNDGNDEIKGVLVVVGSIDKIMADSSESQKLTKVYEMSIVLGIVLLAILACYYLTIPIRRYKKTMVNFAEGYDNKISGVGVYTELKDTIEAINTAIGRFKFLDESRNEFVSNVSHELKTPITSMKVLADSLLSQPDVPNELYREFMEDIAKEIDRENNIITNLLTLVKLDNKQQFEVKNVNINDLIEFILKRLRPIAAQRNIELMMESFRPVVAEVDESKLSSALTNLIENAIKYNKEGGFVHVTLNADHQYFYVRVEDSGVGIPEEDLDYIFERFFRVDKSHSKEISGTGLGLSIVKNVILMHRGSIKVNSTLGEGSTFNVMIPLTYVR